MVDLSKPWPLGLDTNNWWRPALGAIALFALALVFDRQISQWAQGWPEALRGPLAQITTYGESDWILYPAAFFFVITAVVAVFVRWKLMRTLLWQFAALYAFIFVGVGLPSLTTTILKSLIGRGRPSHFDDAGLFGLRPNSWGDWTYQSLPSGHATTAFALAGVVGFVSARWFGPMLGFGVVIAISRVALGVHYPADVVAGAFVGLAGAYLVRSLFARQRWMFEARPDGQIVTRPMSSLKRYLALRKRDSARGLRPNRP